MTSDEFSVIIEKLDGQEKQLSKITRLLEGERGNDGLIIEVDRLKQAQLAAAGERKEAKDEARWAKRAGFGAVIGLVAQFLAFILWEKN
jgi:hypothetical protein